MALSSSNISPTCRVLANLGPGLARPPAPTAGAFFFREFVASADSFLLLHRRSHRWQANRIATGNGGAEQRFGAE